MATLIIATVTIAAGCASSLVLPPVPAVQWDGAERKSFPFQGRRVEYFVARSTRKPPQAYVLRLTGDAAGAARFTASRWNQHPVEVWVVNYPGYGQSNGPRSLKQLAAVALQSYDQLRLSAGDKPIFVEGVSLATTPALLIAAKRQVAGVILQNPPPLRELILGMHGWWNLWLIAAPVAMQVPRELDSLANARAVHAPVVFLLAEKDSVVPPKYQQKVVDACTGDTRIIRQKGADHNEPLSRQDEQSLQVAIDWMWAKNLAPQPLQPAPMRD
ncbi:MAG TPA: hypothetical protein VF669_10225 [Tepidisphaeraceae bacterium]